MMKCFDAVVLGVGGVGSAALFHLASRGMRVLGVDRFPPGHDRGSSHGQSRVIRKAYFEHPDYVPLLKRAYGNWFQLEELAGRKLYHPVGLLEVGPRQGIVIQGLRKAALEHDLPLEDLTPDDVQRRFGGFFVPPGNDALFEADAGYLCVEQCVEEYVRLSLEQGAELAIGETILQWKRDRHGLLVRTDCGEYRTARIVITAGAWATQLLSELGIRYRILRKHMHWFPVNADSCYQQSNSSPVFFYETAEGFFYGFPAGDKAGVKVAEHGGGEEISDPLSLNRDVDSNDLGRVANFLTRHLPQLPAVPTKHSACMYTMTNDEHFVVDMHPEAPDVCFAAGLSGHGFKFASALGEVLADFVEMGESHLPVQFLSSQRPGIA